jgi:hypothetical protein
MVDVETNVAQYVPFLFDINIVNIDLINLFLHNIMLLSLLCAHLIRSGTIFRFEAIVVNGTYC